MSQFDNKATEFTVDCPTHTGENSFEHIVRTKNVPNFRSHTEEKPFKCGFCFKTFKQETNMEIHVRIHTGEKPFICGICGEGYKSEANLNYHENKCHKY